MYKRAFLICALSVGMLALTGCQRLNVEKTVTIDPTAVYALIVPAPSYEQKVTVHISSPGVPVTAYLVRESEQAAAQAKLESEKTPASSFAGKEKSEDITLEATIPAKTEYVLLIRSGSKKTEVKVKLTGR
jgi:hypothetical protein